MAAMRYGVKKSRLDKELEDIRQAFRVFDKDGDGVISRKEVGKLFRNLDDDVNEADIQSLLSEIDTNSNGTIEFDEFVTLYRKTTQNEEDASLAAFQAFDKDGNGFIDAKELKDVLNSLGEKCSTSQCKKILKAADRDGDKKISYEEFVQMLDSQ